MRQVFNGSREVAPQRKAAYKYVPITLKAAQPALELPEGGEIHYDDGSIIQCDAGDWVVEGFDGQLRRIPRDTFALAYEIDKADTVTSRKRAAQRAEQYQPVEPHNDDAVPAAGEMARDEQLPTEPARVPSEEAADTTGDGPTTVPAEVDHLADAQAKLRDGKAKDLTGAEKNALQQAAVTAQQEAAAKLAAVVEQAEEDGLVSEDEAIVWLDTGVPPEGVTIDHDGEQYVVSRPSSAAPSSLNPTGTDEAEAEGAPAE